MGSLVLKLISSKEKESVLDKEQKMFKNFNMSTSYQGGIGSLSAWNMGPVSYAHLSGPVLFLSPGPGHMPQPRFTPPMWPRFSRPHQTSRFVLNATKLVNM